jgi:hypothetical protein
MLQVGNISFCNKIASNIKLDATKQEILSFLQRRYKIKILCKHYEKIQPGNPIIKKIPHLSCLRTNGNPYYMYLTRYNFRNTCFFIDKKIQYGYCLPRIIICVFNIDSKLFEHDTLFEGEMVHCNDNSWRFIINDALVLRGKRVYESMPFRTRLLAIHNELANSFSYSPTDPCVFEIKRYFLADEMDTMIKDFMPSLPYTCRGIYFIPLEEKHSKMYWNFDDKKIKSVVRKKYSENFDTIENVRKRIHFQHEDMKIPETKMETHTRAKDVLPATYKMIEITNTPDLYLLYDEDGSKLEGHLRLPKLSMSEHVYKLFEKRDQQNLLGKIKIPVEFSERFDGWVPKI